MNLDTFLTALYTIIDDLYRRNAGGDAPPPQREAPRGNQRAAVAPVRAGRSRGPSAIWETTDSPAKTGSPGGHGTTGRRRWRPGTTAGRRGEHWQRWLRSRLQVIESVNGVLTGVFHLGVPRTRSRWGLLVRTSAKVSAPNLGIRLNRHFERPDMAFATLFRC